MASAVTGRCFSFALAATVGLFGIAPHARALEVLGLQVHGFAEMQVRGLNRDFQEELDLAQWYNVVNVEIEADFLPDGWGPFDLLQGYVRIEGRYDCIYSEGCGTVPSANVYGNDSEDLPLRLRDANDIDFGGVIDANEQTEPSGIVRRIRRDVGNPVGWAETEVVDTPLTLDANDVNKYHPGLVANLPPFFGIETECPVTNATDSVDAPEDPRDPKMAPGCIDNRRVRTVVRKREGFPGFDTLFDTKGPDGVLGNDQDYEALGVDYYDPDLTARPDPGRRIEEFDEHFRGLALLRDDPGYYTFQPVLDWRFAHRSFPGAGGGNGTSLPMGPWLPGNRWDTLAALRDRAHPLRGRETPVFLQVDGVTTRGAGIRFNDLDCAEDGRPIDPRCSNFDGPDEERIDVDYGPDPVDPRLTQLTTLLSEMVDRNMRLEEFNIAGTPRLILAPGPLNGIFNGVRGDKPFGGDYSGFIPCFNPDRKVGRDIVVGEKVDDTFSVQQLYAPKGRGAVWGTRKGCIPFTNVRVTGGGGELPMRVAPDWSNLAALTDGFDAQGLYIPSYGLLKYAAGGGDFDDHQFNFTETDRAFNHGASQSDTYELKEAYIDLESLDSRLWIRAGLQNIVWGKTELFRTTDQFNPQDLALASLPALEESRIALLSWRAVYSLYDVGPLEDVRVELAMNFDRVKPADLGACGEPYTPDIVCGLTLGSAIHSLTGVGVAAYDRPPNGWDDVDGLEFGGRIEFRWDRFSFAIVDFYGYNDFPYPEPIFFYERNVDPDTAMPRKANARGDCRNRAAFVADGVYGSSAGLTVLHGGDPYREAVLREERLSNELPGFEGGDPAGFEERQVRPTGLEDNFDGAGGLNDDWWRRKESYSLFGIGTDSDCLKPGGAPNFPNENRFDERLAGDPADFENYSSNVKYVDPNDPSQGIVIDGSIRDDTYSGFTVGANAAGENTAMQWTREGFSVDYALVHHPGNQQLFNFICSGTVSIAVAVAPEACAWNLWGSDSLLANDASGPPFSEMFSVSFAGDPNFTDSNHLLGTVISATKGNIGGMTMRHVGLATLNSDVRDGRIGATDNAFNLRVGLAPGNVRLKDMARDVFDAMTLDNSLTWQQKAALGCGPAYGTRCDSGAAVVRVEIVDCKNLPNFDGKKCPNLIGNEAALFGEIDIENETVARIASQRYRMRKNPDTCDPNAAPGEPGYDETGEGCVCPPENLSECRIWGRGGGLDVLNAEASVVVQSFSGFEGTHGRTNTDYDIDTWVTWAKDTPQPGTIGLSRVIDEFGEVIQEHKPFGGGVVCSRYAPGSRYADSSGLVKLPGCRGAVSATVDKSTLSIEVEFEPFYSPHVDGCVFGHSMTSDGGTGDTYYVQAMRRNAAGELEKDVELQNELYESCFNNGDEMLTDPDAPGGQRKNIHYGDGQADPTWFSYTRRRDHTSPFRTRLSWGAGHLFHPVAQCEEAGAGFVPGDHPWNSGWRDSDGDFHPTAPDPDDPTTLESRMISDSHNLCRTLNRDYEDDFLDGNAQVFRNELAAVSYNLQLFLAVSSCNIVSGDDPENPECFNQNAPWAPDRCSLSTPHYCRNVKGFLGVAGVSRNDPRAGGNAAFGRRDFIWHSGGEVALRYKRRNVFGFSMDFAEDVTKTNWGMEFTWIGKTPWADNNSMSNTTGSDTFNLTISVDRPTFINFLNANRTFFFNTQWFFNYIPEHGNGFTTFKNPFNVLFTVAMFTGYYQDRFLPQIITVYDFGSRSAGILPQLQYRFTEAFSVTFGVSFFLGRSEYVPMPVRGFAPDSNRAGPNAYKDGVTRLLSLISRRDEMWMRLRWTF
ncbi:MAG: hypothetical protein JRH16_04520 [Deltaproteobacteria bacterium]|nr:hypothetical protein [Deltaproteobacteria bacterium]MBW2361318.1 hypothetical protein [Deltaproteobacteria bacterium]